MVAQERRSLADLLDELTAGQLHSASLCRGWTVHDVAAHVVMVLEVGTAEVLRALAVARGSYDRANVALTRRWARRPAADLAASLRRRAESRFTPPGQGPQAPLTDTLVHELDIVRPLGIARALPAEPLRLALDFLMQPRPVSGGPAPTMVPKGLLNGLRLHATDLDWQAGRGAEVSGRADDLLLAITGRAAAADRLAGDGTALLRRRLR